MRLVMQWERQDGCIVYTKIEPVIRRGVHKIAVEVSLPQKKTQCANFFVDSEKQAWDFVRSVSSEFSDYISESPIILDHWKKNNLGELYHGKL